MYFSSVESSTAVLSVRDILGKNVPCAEMVANRQVEVRWYARNPPPVLHDQDHHTETDILTGLYIHLSAALQLHTFSNFERDVLSKAAQTHDIARVHDGDDPYHGVRAATKIFLPQFPMEESYKPLVARIVAEHTKDGLKNKHSLTRVLNVVDSLLWIRSENLDLRFLYEDPVAHLLLPVAQQLHAESQSLLHRACDKVTAVIEAGMNLRLLR